MRTYLKFINPALLGIYVLLAFPLWNGYLRPSSPSAGGLLKSPIEGLHRQSQEKARVRTVNLLMPADYRELTNFLNSPEGRDPQALLAYIPYYRALAETLPAPISADAYAMLGFCFYHQQKTAEAMDSYVKSLQLNPAFLSTYYNLALLEFQSGNYAQAADLISSMMAINPEMSLQVVAASKIYSDVLRGESGIDPSLEIKKTYADAMRILVISQYRLGKFPELLNAARYAVESGFGPVEVFQYYTALSMASAEDRQQADDASKDKIYTGQDMTARFF